MNFLPALPQHFSDQFLGIPLLSWATATAVAIFSYVAMRTLIGAFRKNIADRTPAKMRHFYDLIPQVLGSTSNLALAITAILIGVATLDMPARWGDRVNHLWFLAFGLQLALWLSKAISIASKNYFISATPDGSLNNSVSHTIFVWALQSVLWIVFLLAMLSNVGINISAFIASLGIGGVAIALAVQNVLGDLFASLSIAVDKPFEVGDAINVNGISGTVENVGLKTTRLRADSGEQLVISNADLLKNTIRNYKRMKDRRIQASIRIASDTPPDVAGKVPTLIKRIIESQGNVRFDRAHLKQFDRSSIEFEMVYFVLKPDYGLYMDIQQEVNLRIMQELRGADISYGEPVQKFEMQGRDPGVVEIGGNDGLRTH